MLLNQCLAISLSPIVVCTTTTTKTTTPLAAKYQDEERKQSTSEKTSPEAATADKCEVDCKQQSLLSPAAAANLFKQLVEQNSSPLSAHKQKLDTPVNENNNYHHLIGEAIKRVEFAGFVLPTWLLLSGSYNDLHCLKNGWSEGCFKPPVGFRIETIGNIRSVNIDYLSSLTTTSPINEKTSVNSNNLCNNNDQQKQLEEEQKEVAKRTKKSPKQQNCEQIRVSRSHERKIVPKFESLNSAILESVIELSTNLANQTGKQIFVNNKFEEENFVIKGVLIGSLIEHLKEKYANLIDLPPVEFIDCAINGLLRTGQLEVKPMTQEQMQTSYYFKQQQQQQQPITNYLTSHHQKHQNHQSVFVDQLIEPSRELLLLRNHHQEQKSVWPKQQSTSQQQKSKSTTLDSGIQSWDLGNSPTQCDITTSGSSGSSSSGSTNSGSTKQQYFKSNGSASSRQRAASTSITSPKTNNNSNVSPAVRLHDSHYKGSHQAEQLNTATGQVNQLDLAPQTVEVGEKVDGGKQKSSTGGFSLTRSLSFKPKKAQISSSTSQQTTGALDNRWRNEEAFGGNKKKKESATLLNSMQQQHETSQSNKHQTANNLTSLFRSKSMRIISSGNRFSSSFSGSSKRQTLQHEEAKQNLDYHQQQSSFDNGHQHLSRRDQQNWNEFHPQEFKVNSTLTTKGGRRSFHHQQVDQNRTTIDYLTTAQPHKRSLSVRRNSFLSPFVGNNNNDQQVNLDSAARKEDSNGSGRIALFLRKLFSVRRSRSAVQERALNCSAATAAADDQHVGALEQPIDPLRASEELACAMERALPKTTIDASTTTTNSTPLLRKAPKKSVSASPTSSSASSGSNSLIEILDCSPAVNRSKRTLREEEVPALDGGLNRARSWRLTAAKRSESSLSQNSETSCSTTKSTVSQQLRRHLDEAYKRHRNCTNQREKEFIDSINVLRQASRHALQNSRSPSKSRQTKSTGSGSSSQSSRAKSSASDTTTTSSLCDGSSIPANDLSPLPNDDVEVELMNRKQSSIDGDLLDTCMSSQCHCKRLYEVEDDHQHHYLNRPLTNTDLNTITPSNQLSESHHQQRQQFDEELPLILTTNSTSDEILKSSTNNQNNNIRPQLNPTDQCWQHEMAPTGSCCLCSTYQQLATCPLAYCPSTHTGSMVTPSLTCCCFSMNNNNQQLPHNRTNTLSQISDSLIATDHLPNQPPTPDLCCPLWRSMLYAAYCQPASMYPPPLLNNPPLNSPTNQQLNDQIQRQLENHYSSNSSHHHQQHQHNTTIDLKIEIGAGFRKKKKKTTANRGFKLEQSNHDDDGDDDDENLEEEVNTDESLGDDSLDSTSGHQTDESLITNTNVATTTGKGKRSVINNTAGRKTVSTATASSSAASTEDEEHSSLEVSEETTTRSDSMDGRSSREGEKVVTS